ncbi:hypothetical protein LTS10_011624 [Elasticomyces elasticus]|nr:hypothetical protein LTS10_011624 [Elasticomyces elasticus]
MPPKGSKRTIGKAKGKGGRSEEDEQFLRDHPDLDGSEMDSEDFEYARQAVEQEEAATAEAASSDEEPPPKKKQKLASTGLKDTASTTTLSGTVKFTLKTSTAQKADPNPPCANTPYGCPNNGTHADPSRVNSQGVAARKKRDRNEPTKVCSACSHRYKSYKKKSDETGISMDDSWRKPVRKGRKKADKLNELGLDSSWRTSRKWPKKPSNTPVPSPCSNAPYGCPRSATKRKDPSGDGQLCENCYNMWLNFRSKNDPNRVDRDNHESQESDEVDSDGGDSSSSSKSLSEQTHKPKALFCNECERMLPDNHESSDGLCEHCEQRRAVPGATSRLSCRHLEGHAELTYAALRDLAHQQWRLLHPIDPFADHQRAPPVGPDYELLQRKRLTTDAVARGLFTKPEPSKPRQVYLLQYDDAWNGTVPRVSPSGASELHRRSYDELRDMAWAAGYRTKIGPGNDASGTAEDFISFLSTQRDYFENLKPIDKDKRDLIWRSAITNLLASIPSPGGAEEPVTHQTHNGGITGSEVALGALHQTMLDGHYPSETSSRGFLCGPRALAASLQAVRRVYHYEPEGDPIVPVTIEQMLALLFTNPEAGRQPGAVGIPTPEYEVYLENHLAGFDEGNGEDHSEAYLDEMDNMIRLNDMDYQQLIAILHLARQAGLTEAMFTVGIVRDAHLDPTGATVPAFAAIVHHGEPGAGTIWLHHNTARGGGRYNHWEGFEDMREVSNFETALEWGVLTPQSGDLPKVRFNPRDEKSVEDEIGNLARLATNARHILNKTQRLAKRACKTCRKNGKWRSCERLPKCKHCGNCNDDPGECEWQEGSFESEYTGWRTGSEITPEMIEAELHMKPLSQIEEEEQLYRSFEHVADSEPTGAHFRVYGIARRSTTPNAPTLVQLMQSLILTLHAYDGMMSNPALAHAREAQRPGGLGTPMWSHRTVLGRHANKMFPTHLGNLNDLMLRALVIAITHMLSANNQNHPVETHFVLMGFAGMCVDINAWGNRAQGLVQMIAAADQLNGTNYLGTTYIVIIAEPHVVDPNSPSSINAGQPAHGTFNHNKRVLKYRLIDAVDRHQTLMNLAHNMGIPWQAFMEDVMLLHQGLPPVHQFVLPAWPANRGGVNEAYRLDRFIMAMYWEKAWRAAWLDAFTMPADHTVATNNVNRNNRML